jgi:hypothetical protein
MVYYTLLYSGCFSESFYDTFKEPNSVDSVSGAVYDEVNTLYHGNTGDFITHTVINGSTLYHRFSVHVETSDGLDYTVEYSVNNGVSWNTIDNNELDDVILVNTGFTSLMIRITWNTEGNIISYGVMYNYNQNGYSTDVSKQEIWIPTSDHDAPYDVTLPNGMNYTKDGKSLEVYHNRVRLINNTDFEELNSRQIRMNVDIKTSDTLVFIERYGLVDNSIENQQRLNTEHDENGYHVFEDRANGNLYKLYVENGILNVEQL